MQNFYIVLTEIIQAQLSANAINAQLVNQITTNIIDTLADRHGGKSVYLSRLYKKRATSKHRQILAHFNGKNHDEVCQKYGITRVWLTKIVGKAKAHGKVIGQHV